MNIIEKRATNPASALTGAELVYVAQAGDDAVTTIQDIAAWILTPTINMQVDGDYTLQPVDNDGKTYLGMYRPDANEVLVPLSQTRTITIRQSGDGITTLVADTGVTLIGNPVFSGAGDTKTLVPIYVDEFASVWDIIGASA